MQWREEQSGPYGEELLPLCLKGKCSGRKIQNETIVVDYGGVWDDLLTKKVCHRNANEGGEAFHSES